MSRLAKLKRQVIAEANKRILNEDVYDPFKGMSDKEVGKELMSCYEDVHDDDAEYEEINSDIEEIRSLELEDASEGNYYHDKIFSDLGKKWRNTDIGKTYCDPSGGMDIDLNEQNFDSDRYDETEEYGWNRLSIYLEDLVDRDIINNEIRDDILNLAESYADDMWREGARGGFADR